MQLVAELANPPPANRQLYHSSQQQQTVGLPAQPVTAEVMPACSKRINSEVGFIDYFFRSLACRNWQMNTHVAPALL
jgi:hypothetical protein